MLKLKSVYTLSSLHVGCLLLLLPTLAEARSCYYYVDAYGNTRERCRGLLGGAIAGIVVGAIILLILVSTITRLMRRRQQANTLPVVNQLNYAPAPVMGQPTYYPPPTFPPPTQPPYQAGYQGAPTNQYQPPPGPPPPPGEHRAQGVQMPVPAANHV